MSSGAFGVKSETGPMHSRQGEMEERLVSGRFNKQENLLTKSYLGGLKLSRPLNLPSRILKVYREVLMRFSRTHRLDGLSNTCLSQGCVPENSSHCGNTVWLRWRVHSKDKGGGEDPPPVLSQLSFQLAVTSSG